MVTVFNGGTFTCTWLFDLLFGWYCSTTSFGPDLEAELIAPDGTTVLDLSTCSFDADTLCGVGEIWWFGSMLANGTGLRQETVLARPPLQLGWYTVRIFPFDPSDSSTFVMDITGPLATSGGSPSDNNPPVAQNDNAATDEDTPATVNVLDGDSDPDPGDTVTLQGCASASTLGAAVAVSGDGTQCVYDPAGVFNYLQVGESEIDTFTYTVTDGSLPDTGTVTVTVNGVNDAPNAADDPGNSTDEGVSVTIAVLGNDSDPGTSPRSRIPQTARRPRTARR
jgi:VCBS repeat-containing protein